MSAFPEPIQPTEFRFVTDTAQRLQGTRARLFLNRPDDVDRTTESLEYLRCYGDVPEGRAELMLSCEPTDSEPAAIVYPELSRRERVAVWFCGALFGGAIAALTPDAAVLPLWLRVAIVTVGAAGFYAVLTIFAGREK
jgi:hypothetical protein